MADVEVHLIGRLSAAGITEQPIDVLLFATPDHSRMLPVWVPEPADLGGRPTDAEILATLLASNDLEDPWFAEIATNSRGQMTAGLKQGERYIDVRPSTLEKVWHAGVLFDVRVKEAVSGAMLPVNPEFIEEVQELIRKANAAEDDDDAAWEQPSSDLGPGDESAGDLVLTWRGLPTVATPDVVDEFADMWKAMGLSDDMDEWLGGEERGE